MFLFIRFLPVISITEMRELVHETQQDQERQAESATSARGQAMSTKLEQPAVYGIMAEFDRPEDLIEATQHAYDRGYRLMEAYTPFPGRRASPRRSGSIATGFPGRCSSAGCWAESAASSCSGSRRSFHYPLNIGGRPFNSWPAFIPITFELTILSAAIIGRAGHARAQWSAAAASSGLQRAELRPGVAQPVFPLPAGARPVVRAGQRAAIPGRA